MTAPPTTVRALLVGLLCARAALELQGCGGAGYGGGGYGGGGKQGTEHPNPPAAPGPCACIGSSAFNEPNKPFARMPKDTGKWCNQWHGEHMANGRHARCKDGGADGDDWKKEWCEKVFCIVAEDCEVDDTAKMYDGNFVGDPHYMEGFWSSKNCDESLYPSESSDTTASP